MERIENIRSLLPEAVSAINGCEMCVRSHERVVLEGGLTEAHVHDAVRIAAVVPSAAVALEAGGARAFPRTSSSRFAAEAPTLSGGRR